MPLGAILVDAADDVAPISPDPSIAFPCVIHHSIQLIYAIPTVPLTPGSDDFPWCCVQYTGGPSFLLV